MSFDPRLGGRFMFDADDLAANREGRLSVEQERMFRVTAEVMHRRTPRVLVALAVVFAATIALVVVANAAAPGGGDPKALAVAGAILAWIIGIVAFFMLRGRRVTRAFEQRELRCAEGPLRIRTSATETWFAHIGEARIGVDRYQAETLEEGADYRVFYVDSPDGGLPLSLERITAEGSR